MNRIKCPQCGLVNRLDAPSCLRCKTNFIESQSDAEYSPEAFHDDLSVYYEPEPKGSIWARILDRRRTLAWLASLVVIALLLNQTAFVSSWFVSQDVGAVLKNLKGRAENPKASAELREAADRVTTLAIHASRGRRTAITELVNLDGTTLGVSVPNPDTQEREKREQATNYGPNGPFSTEPWPKVFLDSPYAGYKSPQGNQYLSRSGAIYEYVDDILVYIGEPAVGPILDRIQAAQAARQAGDKSPNAEINGNLIVVLGRIKSPSALDRLIEYASMTPYNHNNAALLEALCYYDVDDPRLVQVYDTALTEAASETQAGVTYGNFNSDFTIMVISEGLAKIKSEASLKVLLAHLDVGQPGRKSHVVQAIARHGSMAVPAVLEVINSSSPKLMRENALATLGVLKATETKSDVVALLDHTELHDAAIEALVQWADAERIPDLEAAAQRHPERAWKYWNGIDRLKRKAAGS